jgi:SAM-dependent methyltransferase
VAEHFVGEDRKEVVLNHLRLLKKGGLAFIAVPNHQSPHYWIHRKICELRGGMLCEETPFSKNEIKYILGKDNYKIIKTFGSNIIADLIWLFYPLSILSTLIGYNKSTNIHKKFHEIEENIMYFFSRRKDYIGNIIGYGFTLIVEKK